MAAPWFALPADLEPRQGWPAGQAPGTEKSTRVRNSRVLSVPAHCGQVLPFSGSSGDGKDARQRVSAQLTREKLKSVAEKVSPRKDADG